MTDVSGQVSAVPLTRGEGSGPVVVLSEPVSFWGGVDLHGTIIDHYHPQVGASLTGVVLVMASGRGSSSASSVLAELIRTGLGPVAIVLEEADAIIALGALVADELYDLAMPVVQVPVLSSDGLVSGRTVTVTSDPAKGTATISLPLAGGSRCM